MAKRTTKKTTKPVRPQLGDGVEILNAGSVLEDPITRTLETNYMPYAMSVIVSRALPEIDGFKPAHRKLLYTMYGMGLLKGARTKSANIVGSTMHLNPHGDAAIYDTMVRMGRGNESLLVPFVDSKGNFGKAYSRDMSCAAARYTEAKLESVCEELFRDIDKETVDFVPNYDGTTTEPTLLPVTFPTILANNTLGIAVGMACNICSFNLAELCNTTVALMKNAKHDISTTMPAPDFVGGGQILYDEAQMRDIFENGRGSVKVRARYAAVPGENMIEITQIPPTTTVEAIMDKIAELVKAGKIREISDMRDETDLNGLKLTLDLKRGVDADKLMAKLFKATPLEDSFSCNFNILVSGQPRVMGVREILQEWTAFRMECVRRRTYYDLHGKEKRLHLLKGLAAILMDIDKAIHIIRTTEEETEVVPNLMIGFGIDEVQADYVAEIKLRHLNREYILKRTGEIEQLEADIADLNDILAKPARIRKIIMKELADVAKKYGQPRRSEILYDLILCCISGGMSRLYRKLYDEGLTNPGFGGEVLRVDGCCCILFTGESDVPDTVKQLLLEEIRRIRAEGVDREIFTLCKNEKYGQLIENLENVEDSASQMADFALSGQTVAQQIATLAALTAEDADAALQKILSEERMAVMYIQPDGTAGEEPDDEEEMEE